MADFGYLAIGIFVVVFVGFIVTLIVLLVIQGDHVPAPPTFPTGFSSVDKTSVIDQATSGDPEFYIQNQNGSFLNLKPVTPGGTTGPFQPYMFPSSAAGFTTTGSSATPAWIVTSDSSGDCPNSFLIGTLGGTCLSVSGITGMTGVTSTTGATVTCINCADAANEDAAHWSFVDQVDGQSSYSLRMVNCLGYGLSATTNGNGYLISNIPPTNGTNTSYDFYLLQPSILA